MVFHCIVFNAGINSSTSSSRARPLYFSSHAFIRIGLVKITKNLTLNSSAHARAARACAVALVSVSGEDGVLRGSQLRALDRGGGVLRPQTGLLSSPVQRGWSAPEPLDAVGPPGLDAARRRSRDCGDIERRDR